MGPLSLSPASTEKPPFMTSHVLTKMDVFLRDIASDATPTLTPPPHDAVATEGATFAADGLHLLLEFNLARGHVAGETGNT